MSAGVEAPNKLPWRSGTCMALGGRNETIGMRSRRLEATPRDGMVA